MAIVIILKDDDGRLYVSEHENTNDVDKATKYPSLEEMLLTVPIMKDWNWDFCVYEYNKENRHQKLIKEDIWMPMYRKFKEENKLRY
jgi:hypothetical protein